VFRHDFGTIDGFEAAADVIVPPRTIPVTLLASSGQSQGGRAIRLQRDAVRRNLPRSHSYLNAIIGSTLEALRAGR
jgi:hypothetical protein